MAHSIVGDEGLRVRFYTLERTTGTPGVDEMVEIITPFDPGTDVHQKALSVSHVDETGAQVTYAQRFAGQYALFKSGKAESIAKRKAELAAQMAALDAEQIASNVAPTPAQLRLADKASAEPLQADTGAAEVSPAARKRASDAVADVIADAAKKA